MNLIGRRFYCLTVADKAKSKPHAPGSTYWRCICDCGGEVVLSTSQLFTGTIKSCCGMKNWQPMRTVK